MSRPTDGRASAGAAYGPADEPEPFANDQPSPQPAALYLDRDKHPAADADAAGAAAVGPRKATASRSGLQLSRTNTTLRDPRLHNTKTRVQRYDERYNGLFDDADLSADRSAPRSDDAVSGFGRIVLAKKAYRLLVFLVVWVTSLGLRTVANQIMDVSLLHTAAGDDHQLYLDLSACYVTLSADGAAGSGLRVQYTGHQQVFSPDILFTRKIVTHTATRIGTTSRVQVTHDYEDYSCKVDVTVPANIVIQRLTVNCSQCTVVARGRVSIDVLELLGNAVSANFGELSAGGISVNVKAGALQFHELTLQRDSTFLATNATVVVQLRQDFGVKLAAATDLYCISAPNIVTVSAMNCAVTQITDAMTRHVYNLSNYTRCDGAVSVCSSASCTPTVTLTFQSLTGSFYANLLTTAGSKDVGPLSSLNVLSGGIFNNGIKLGQPDYQLLYSTFQQANNPNSLPLLLKLDIGNYKGESSSSSKWIISQYPLSSVFSPWMVASTTFGIYTKNFQELNINLAPAFCPYRPTITRRQHAAIKSLLTTVSNAAFTDTVYTGLVLEKDDPILSAPTSNTSPEGSGFFNTSYEEEPLISDVATTFGSEIEEALVSPNARVYNNPNISTWICRP